MDKMTYISIFYLHICARHRGISIFRNKEADRSSLNKNKHLHRSREGVLCCNSQMNHDIFIVIYKQLGNSLKYYGCYVKSLLKQMVKLLWEIIK